MRKRSKRLALHRETLHRLDPSNLRRVLGGTDATREFVTTCQCTVANCPSDCCGTDTCNGCGGGGETLTREFITTCVC